MLNCSYRILGLLLDPDFLFVFLIILIILIIINRWFRRLWCRLWIYNRLWLFWLWLFLWLWLRLRLRFWIRNWSGCRGNIFVLTTILLIKYLLKIVIQSLVVDVWTTSAIALLSSQRKHFWCVSRALIIWTLCTICISPTRLTKILIKSTLTSYFNLYVFLLLHK